MKPRKQPTLPNLPESMELVWAIKYALVWGILPEELQAEIGPINLLRQFELVSFGAIHKHGDENLHRKYRVAIVRIHPATGDSFTVALILKQVYYCDVLMGHIVNESPWTLVTAIKRVNGVRKHIPVRRCLLTQFDFCDNEAYVSSEWWPRSIKDRAVAPEVSDRILRNWDKAQARAKAERDEARRMRRQTSV